jgi:murein DD-endopeptidase MepM/ murein hydrolase activator NlpD
MPAFRMTCRLWPPPPDARAVLLALGLLLWAVAAAMGPPGAAHASGTVSGAGVGPTRFDGVADAGARAGRGTWPVPPPVLRKFAPPPVRWAAGHRGVDLAAGAGTVVRAALGGTITFAGEVAGTPVTVVTHPDTGSPPLRTTYEPVAASLPVGAGVATGQPIGVITGSLPGGHCGGCLHWGLLRAHHYLDPLSLLGLGRVRLLPLER